jgi:glyoxylase I family protein
MTFLVTGHVPLLQVFDMPASMRFYRDILGFSEVANSGERDTPEGRFAHWVWLRLGSSEIMLNTAYDEGERPQERDEARWAGHNDVCLYFGCDDVDAAFYDLRQRIPGLNAPQTTSYGMRQLTLEDPDGYALCFQAPN